MLAVVLEGGVVKAVISNDPACPIREVTVIDYDTRDCDAQDLLDSGKMVPQGNGSASAALVASIEVEPARIDLDGMRGMNSADLKALGFSV